MKELLLLLIIILTLSCGKQRVIITEKTPFIVGNVTKTNEGYVYTNRRDMTNFLGGSSHTIARAIIITDTLLYNVGDTIKLKL